MGIQRQLLLEQIELLKKCELGQQVMRGLNPRSIDEFREIVPLTTYEDYMSGLPRRPVLWQYTSGKSGEYTYRWVPVTARQLDEIEPLIFALLLFATCKRRGEVAFNEMDKVLYGMAPPPYAPGTTAEVSRTDPASDSRCRYLKLRNRTPSRIESRWVRRGSLARDWTSA